MAANGQSRPAQSASTLPAAAAKRPVHCAISDEKLQVPQVMRITFSVINNQRTVVNAKSEISCWLIVHGSWQAVKKSNPGNRINPVNPGYAFFSIRIP
jgi:hypothetical protein